MEFLHEYTKDNLLLQGIHWECSEKNICVVFTHGMSGNIIENYFPEVLGETLAKSKIGFIYGHNRGFGHINDIKTREPAKDGGLKTKRYGQIFDNFEECLNDIELWVTTSKKLGYKKIILMGHSLGCNKTIYYYSKKPSPLICGVILASPPDMVGLAKMKKYQPNYEEMLKEANNAMLQNNPKKILTSILWNWFYISAKSFLSLCIEDCSADNLPVLKNPKKFEQLSKINVPIFAFMGENDDIAIRTLSSDLELIKSKATKCPQFETKILSGANHNYVNKEKELSNMIINWIKKFR